ncbi:MAG: hypothetical protein OXF74_04105 [Rhodobacteraceae bacterium]|nr:hypothetical protein [Paracoccaceae bacterium]
MKWDWFDLFSRAKEWSIKLISAPPEPQISDEYLQTEKEPLQALEIYRHTEAELVGHLFL